MYILYPVFLFMYDKIFPNKITINKEKDKPRITLIMCAYNEEEKILTKILNIAGQIYEKDKTQIIFVDDGSSDNTKEIIESNKEKLENFLLLNNDERKGKSYSINRALEMAQNELIILTDVTPILPQDSLSNLVEVFSDERVGCASGLYVPKGGENYFWKFKNSVKLLESAIDSTSYLSGGLLAFRKKLIDSIDLDSIGDDVNIALKVRKQGYRSICYPEAKLIQNIATDIQDYKTQKVRRSLGGIIETMRFKKMILNPSYGFFGFIIMPNRYLFTVFNPVIVLLSIISTLAFYIQWPTIIIIIISGLLTGLLLIPEIVTDYLKATLVQLLALKKYYFESKRNVIWKQIKSTRREEE